MKTIRDPEAKILSMKVYDREVLLNGQESNLSVENKKSVIEEKKKEVRFEKLSIYQRYQKYKKMMNVYTRHQNTLKNVTNLLKISNPITTLENFFKMEGLDTSKDMHDYRKFMEVVKQAEQENPDIDLRDITSNDSRNVIADVMNQTGEGKEIVPADLDFVAVIEGYGLYKAVTEIEAGQDRDTARKSNGLTEEMLQRAEERKSEFDKTETKKIYDRVSREDISSASYTTAAVLEIGLGEAQKDLESFGLVKNKDEKEPITEECLLVNRKKPELYKLDMFARTSKEYASNKVKQQEIQRLVDEYLNGIEEWNKIQEEEERKYRRTHGGKPSPFFLRELKEYENQRAETQQTQEKPKVIESEREAG